MPLDRTWFNNLVDDDGSNQVGTVWNKAQIKLLLDSIDAVPAWQGWSGQWFTSLGEVTTPVQNSCRYYVHSKVLHVNLFATEMFFATAAPALQFFLPSPYAMAVPAIERFAVVLRFGQGTTTYELGYATAKDSVVGEIRRANGQNFAGFTHASVHGQGFYLL